MHMFGLMLLVMPVADPAPMPQASRVTLTGTQALAKHVSSLVQQANIAINLDRAVGDRPVALDIKAAPFWQALEQLAKSADHRLVIAGQGGKIALVGGAQERYRAVPSDVQGPFRTSVKRTLSKLDLETGRRFCEVQVEIVWEPRFKAFYAELAAKSAAAQIEAGQPPRAVEEGTSKMPVSGQAIEIILRFADVPRSTKRLSQIQGSVKFAGTSQLLQFAFAAETTGAATTQRQAGVAVSLQRFEKRSRIWTAVVHFEYPKGGPEFESFQSFLLDNECWLERADGMKFANSGFEAGGERGGTIPVSYHFQENPKAGFTIGDPRGWKLVVRTPGPIVEVPLRFSLKDVPLP